MLRPVSSSLKKINRLVEDRYSDEKLTTTRIKTKDKKERIKAPGIENFEERPVESQFILPSSYLYLGTLAITILHPMVLIRF